MRTGRLIVICIAVLAAACSEEPLPGVVLRPCASMPSPRACSVCFTFNGRAYVFAGRDSRDTVRNDLWCYDPAADRWDSIGEAPLPPRVNATACIAEGKVYIGLGFNGAYQKTGSYLQDWWEFDPAALQWKQLAGYPNTYTDAATSFAGEGELYVGYGFCNNYRRDMFRYDIAADRWDSIDTGVSFQGYPVRSFGGTGCTCRGRHFMGTGFFGRSLDWWAELTDGTHWERRAAVPGKTRTTAASCATNDYIYLCGGLHYGGANTTGDVLRDIRRYDPLTDQWTYIAALPEGLFNHVCFAIGRKVYIGLGETEEWKTNGLMYCFEE